MALTFKLYLPHRAKPLRPARLILLALIAALIAIALLRCRADRSVTTTLPDYPVTINGLQWDNRTAPYPLLSYDGVTYLPASAAGCLGLRVDRTAEGGISVSVTAEAEPYEAHPRETPNPHRASAAVLSCPITVAGVPFDNSATLYPFLEYRGTVYIPMTEKMCGTLCVEYDRDSGAGLSLRATGRLRGTLADELPHFILHMGGVTADGQIYTNSIEAADYSYECGYRWMELDFNWTSDGALVCIHDWGNWKLQQTDPSVNPPLTLAEFTRLDSERSDFHSFTPATLETWLKEHPGAMIVTDVKEHNIAAMEWLAEHYPDLRDRLIVQIYSLDEYMPISELGYSHIILTMYRIPWEEYHDIETLSAFIRDTRIMAITMAAEESVRDVFEALVATGIPVFVHTLNEPEQQSQWMADGAYGVYTDYGDTRASVSSGS